MFDNVRKMGLRPHLRQAQRRTSYMDATRSISPAPRFCDLCHKFSRVGKTMSHLQGLEVVHLSCQSLDIISEGGRIGAGRRVR